MESMETKSSNEKDGSKKVDPQGYFQRWLFALVAADLLVFILFGFLFLVPMILRSNLLIAIGLILASIYYIIKNRNMKLTPVLALLFSLAIFYVNFMMLYGNWVSELLNS